MTRLPVAAVALVLVLLAACDGNYTRRRAELAAKFPVGTPAVDVRATLDRERFEYSFDERENLFRAMVRKVGVGLASEDGLQVFVRLDDAGRVRETTVRVVRTGL